MSLPLGNFFMLLFYLFSLLLFVLPSGTYLSNWYLALHVLILTFLL